MSTECDPPTAAKPSFEELLAAAIVQVAKGPRTILRSREELATWFAALPDLDLDGADETR